MNEDPELPTPPAQDPRDPGLDPERAPLPSGPPPEDLRLGPMGMPLGDVYFPTIRLEPNDCDLGPPGEEEAAVDEDLPEAFRRDRGAPDPAEAELPALARSGAVTDPVLRAQGAAVVGMIFWLVGPFALYYSLVALASPAKGSGRSRRAWAWVWLSLSVVECVALAVYAARLLRG